MDSALPLGVLDVLFAFGAIAGFAGTWSLLTSYAARRDRCRRTASAPEGDGWTVLPPIRVHTRDASLARRVLCAADIDAQHGIVDIDGQPIEWIGSTEYQLRSGRL